MKHAYLIVAHSEFKVLDVLIEMLDYPDNDIYVHIDKKVDYKLQYTPCHSHIHIVPDNLRIDVRWGDCSIIWAELALYNMAYHSSTEYRYYHLISGTELPIKSQSFIQAFFEKNKGLEFIGFMDNPWRSKTKTMYYHIFTKNLQGKKFSDKMEQMIHWTFTQLQKPFPIIRSKEHLECLYKGCTWSSLTHEAVSYILSHEQWIRKRFRWTMATDEIYKHTLLRNSDFRNKFFCLEDEYKGCMLLQDWKRWNGKSYVWTMNEWEEIMNSDKLFARKFSEKHMDIVLKLKEELKKQDAL